VELPETWTHELYLVYLRSVEWANVREEALRRDGHQCTNCPATTNLHGHHVRYERLGRAGEVDDVRTLCEWCHTNEHAPERITRAKARRADRKARQLAAEPTPCGIGLLVDAVNAVAKPLRTKVETETAGVGFCAFCGESGPACPWVEDSKCVPYDVANWVHEWVTTTPPEKDTSCTSHAAHASTHTTGSTPATPGRAVESSAP